MTTSTRPDPVYVSGRREALGVLVIWLAAMAYTVTYCYLHGYGRRVEDLTFVLGFPDWVFWGIITPWLICLGVSWVFAFWFMTDEQLGAEQDEAGAAVAPAESPDA
jgi:hypothetical protein